jgi:hypothetical protein
MLGIRARFRAIEQATETRVRIARIVVGGCAAEDIKKVAGVIVVRNPAELGDDPSSEQPKQGLPVRLDEQKFS